MRRPTGAGGGSEPLRSISVGFLVPVVNGAIDDIGQPRVMMRLGPAQLGDAEQRLLHVDELEHSVLLREEGRGVLNPSRQQVLKALRRREKAERLLRGRWFNWRATSFRSLCV
jgi:hypothetical protein